MTVTMLNRLFWVSLVFLFCFYTPAHAGWLIFYEPELKGKILDIDTKQPIEGAVVVVEYKKATIGLGAGTISSIIDIRETLTNKDGNFRFPSYTTFIQPFSWQIPASVIIFKPGYPSVELGEWYFVGGQIQEQEESWSKELKYRLHGLGIVELPMLRTREERIQAKPAPVGEATDWKKQKKFIEAIRNEWKYLHNKDPKDLYQIKGE